MHAPIDGAAPAADARLAVARRAARRAPAACRRAIPEAFLEAFANVYLGVAADIRGAARRRRIGDPVEADYARVEDGARGVRFIEATVASARSDRKWTAVADPASS